MDWNSWKARKIYASFYKMYKLLSCSCKTSMMTTCSQSLLKKRKRKREEEEKEEKRKSNILQLYSTKLINYIRHSGSHMFAWLWKHSKIKPTMLLFCHHNSMKQFCEVHRFDTYVRSVIVIGTFIGGWRKVIM